MTPGTRPASRAATAWLVLAGTLGAAASVGAGLDPAALEWRPGAAVREPWRALTAVGVHYSTLHLAVNLAGLVLTAAFGFVAEVPARAAAAWLAAWPATQWGLLLFPALGRFGGLSGVLHAGVAVVAVWLLFHGSAGRRAIGAAVAVGCIAKLVDEAAWAPPLLRHPAGWDIATAPVAHLSGCAAGAVCGLAAALSKSRSGPSGSLRHD